MQLSLMFLFSKLEIPDSEVILNGKENPKFVGASIFSDRINLEKDTVYICPCGTDGKRVENVDCEGIIWLGEFEPPKSLPVLWLHKEYDFAAVLCQVQSVFNLFHKWSNMVYEAATKRQPLSNIFNLLNIVTANPWYLADTSFRMIVIKDEPLFCETSSIWRFQYTRGYLPMATIFKMIETNELDSMNGAHRACIFYPKSFNQPFVSKTIFSPDGIVAHFYIISLYSKLTEYEVEIADFFGDVITEMLSHDNDYISTSGGFYDNYFIDLIEGRLTKESILKDVVTSLYWNIEDFYSVVVFNSRDDETTKNTINNIQIHIIENTLPCKAFIYKDYVVAIVNQTKMKEENLESLLYSIINQFGNCAGYSEAFQNLEQVKEFYLQSVAALQYAQEKNKKLEVMPYEKIALKHICKVLNQNLPSNLIVHPAINTLRKYDIEKDSNLCETLYYYLVNEQNTQATAKQLYIHRNSMMYRLEKIKSLTDVDLNDMNTRARLVLSYIMLNINPEM